jgi:hypothetical protein
MLKTGVYNDVRKLVTAMMMYMQLRCESGEACECAGQDPETIMPRHNCFGDEHVDGS